jgi:hypothetical protein
MFRRWRRGVTIRGAPLFCLRERLMLSRTDRERLAKLLGILGSDHVGERDNAALAIERLRRAA